MIFNFSKSTFSFGFGIGKSVGGSLHTVIRGGTENAVFGVNLAG